MYRTGADVHYSKPLCDLCREVVHPGTNEDVLVFSIERAPQVGHGDKNPRKNSKHHGHLCPECHTTGAVIPASGIRIKYHFAGDKLAMIEVYSRKGSGSLKTTPQDATAELLDPISSVAEFLPFTPHGLQTDGE